MATDKIIVSIDPDLEELIPGFLSNRKKDIETLRQALNENKPASLQSIGHSLKGVGGGYGFHEISEIGAEIENQARSGDLSGIGDLIERMADYLGRVEIEYE